MKDIIFTFIKNNYPVKPSDIDNEVLIKRQMIHRYLNRLLDEGKIYKVGVPPKVYYFPSDKNEIEENTISDKYNELLTKNFIYFSPNGDLSYGVEGFIKWCRKRLIEPDKEVVFYKKTLEKYSIFKDKYGLINGIDKMNNTFDNTYLDEVYYIDFYSIEKYGKTLLGNLMFYAKQTGDVDLSTKIIKSIKDPINNLIQKENIDAFAFIPPSIDRKIQLMDELKKGLNFNIKELNLIKIFRDKVVAQKSLNKKDDRISNARDTIFILDKKFKSNTIILIDDAVGSGATLNETAKKIKERGLSKKVIGLAIVGSYKGFEVINEV